MTLDLCHSEIITIPATVHGFARLTAHDVTVHTAAHPRQDVTHSTHITVNTVTQDLTIALVMATRCDVLVCCYGEPWVGVTLTTTHFLHDRANASPYIHHFANARCLTIPGWYHGFGTPDLGIVAHPPPRHVAIDTDSNVVLTFATPATGTALLWPLC